MTTVEQAAQDLKAIRGLMEKATVYRAISSPSALVAGVLTTSASLLFYFQILFERPIPFLVCWLVVLALAMSANSYFLWRGARERGEAFFSPGMRVALRALFPPLLAGGVFSLCLLAKTGDPTTTVNLWVLFYGLALLSTREFAPRSMAFLGWAFLITALLVFATGGGLLQMAWQPATTLMVLTFGVYHILYAVFTWPRTPQAGS